MRKLVRLGATAALLTLGVGGFAGTAPAGGNAYPKVTTYETVYDYVAKQVPYTTHVIKYDHCGKPDEAAATRYKTVEVRVAKPVPVTRYVRVPAHGY